MSRPLSLPMNELIDQISIMNSLTAPDTNIRLFDELLSQCEDYSISSEHHELFQIEKEAIAMVNLYSKKLFGVVSPSFVDEARSLLSHLPTSGSDHVDWLALTFFIATQNKDKTVGYLHALPKCTELFIIWPTKQEPRQTAELLTFLDVIVHEHLPQVYNALSQVDLTPSQVIFEKIS